MNDAPDRDVVVFAEALRLAVAERADYLALACAGDEELRQRVEALLKTLDRVGDFLEQPPAGSGETRAEVEAGEQPGDRIGRYKLLQQIGEGGCGVVFMAEQEEPVRRRVALKVIKPGMDTKSVIARFEAERQALALMDHTNIAHVLDAGATESGRPYFVMELVRGIKITDYCDQKSLTSLVRLDLFIQVCDAVQHAHQKGVIHRDIKPSNILVTTSTEEKPLPKVIDFGIAKATTGQRLTDKTLFTAFEMLIGTPAYMSPEQAELTSLEVDTRTDIYSLGVLLYELLTSTTPFDTRELLKAGLDEVRRVIRDQEPVRPSTRLSTMIAADLTSVSQHRHVEPPKLIREVTLIKKHSPDVVLLDLRMPCKDGLDVIAEVNASKLPSKVIIMTTFDSQEDVDRSMKAGARGYLLKDASQEEILDAIRRVNLGETYLPARIVQRVAEGFRKPGISPRELEVLQGVAAGKSNKEIGVQLFISEGTVKSHVKSLLEKLAVPGRTAAIREAVHRGLVRLN